EGSPLPAKTIQLYQKGKHVMAEPGFLDLRSDVTFEAGSREAILESWQSAVEEQSINVRYQAEVIKVEKHTSAFELTLADSTGIHAEKVVLAIGVAGNPRKLGVPGENLPLVEYQLDDPKAHTDEVIVVIGAGDAAIENALALAKQNTVHIINRRDEFSRAKDGNLNAVLMAISDPSVNFSCFYGTTVKEVIETPDSDTPITIVLETPAGEEVIPCHRVIARLGGIPPRPFVEGIGIEFPNKKIDAVPELSAAYESNVQGVYIIGALAGYPLIKQAMNQGYDVVEFVRGNKIKPADNPLLEFQFHLLPFGLEADDQLALFQRRIPMFREMNALSFRELIIESNIMVSYAKGPLFDEAKVKLDVLHKQLASRDPAPRTARLIEEGDYLFRQGDFATSFFTIVEGEVIIESPDSSYPDRHLGRGEFFGESSLISGQPRMTSARAGANCILVESPRRTMVKLMNSNEEVRAGIDWIFIVRELQRQFAPKAEFADLRNIALSTEIRHYKAGENIYEEGESGASLHLIRRGSVTLTRSVEQQESNLVAELRSGRMVGEMALMGDPVRRETATASVATETIHIERSQFLELIEQNGAQISRLQDRASANALSAAQMEVRSGSGSVMSFLMGEGLGEATNVLIIDEKLCIGCDNCEKACAETHGGISRLNRSAGKSFAHVHIPISCRHCEQPHCMKDCPPDAIHRGIDGEVFIDDSCIGCGNCEANCPYDAIEMAYPAPEKPGLLQWLFFGKGPGPGEEPGYQVSEADKQSGKRAVKCDACINQKQGFACVSACPTGAAQRLSPVQFIKLVG
ncbi:MAG: cyclic nucleotide-binding domain-containing protein, partial [Gammaproteobacteria bacterium]|nr:cyclic nucleotide-binding domain-containing protein [Gammaproteobacteria bacterium]